MLAEVLRGDLIEEFRRTDEADVACSLRCTGRFRCNATGIVGRMRA